LTGAVVRQLARVVICGVLPGSSPTAVPTGRSDRSDVLVGAAGFEPTTP